MCRLLIILLLLPTTLFAMEIPEVSTILPGYYEQICKDKHISKSNSLEGIWYYPDEDMTFAIEPINDIKNPHKEAYRIIVIGSEDCNVDIGSIAGYIEKTAVPKELNIWLYSGHNGENLVKPVKCLAITDSERKSITLEKPTVNLNLSVNILQFLPSIFPGIRLYPHAKSPKAKAGFRKIESTNEPIYF